MTQLTRKDGLKESDTQLAYAINGVHRIGVYMQAGKIGDDTLPTGGDSSGYCCTSLSKTTLLTKV